MQALDASHVAFLQLSQSCRLAIEGDRGRVGNVDVEPVVGIVASALTGTGATSRAATGAAAASTGATGCALATAGSATRAAAAASTSPTTASTGSAAGPATGSAAAASTGSATGSLTTGPGVRATTSSLTATGAFVDIPQNQHAFRDIHVGNRAAMRYRPAGHRLAVGALARAIPFVSTHTRPCDEEHQGRGHTAQRQNSIPHDLFPHRNPKLER